MKPYPLKTSFDHEKLTVYKKAIDFAGWVAKLLEHVPKEYGAEEQV
jgi:hypothetical protein